MLFKHLFKMFYVLLVFISGIKIDHNAGMFSLLDKKALDNEYLLNPGLSQPKKSLLLDILIWIRRNNMNDWNTSLLNVLYSMKVPRDSLHKRGWSGAGAGNKC